MRILIVAAGTLIVCFLALMTTKFWGRSQVYPVYSHPFLTEPDNSPAVIFIKPKPSDINMALATENLYLYLDVAMTEDHILVFPLEKFEKGVRNYKLEELKGKAISVEEMSKHFGPNRKIIFNLLENTRAQHQVFIENMKKINLDKGESFLVMSEYEAPIKALKELAPAYIYGTTKPEILKIVAMQSMHILEAATIRADILVHPLKLRGQDFYNEVLITELTKRHKKIIIGPVTPAELSKAEALKPFGIILDQQ